MMTYRDFKNIINIIKYYRNSSMSTKISTNIAEVKKYIKFAELRARNVICKVGIHF